MIDFRKDHSAWGVLGFISLFMAIVDVLIGSGLVEAVRSESFEPAPGVVTRCEVKRGRKGSVSLDLEYDYTVNGWPFTGTKYHVQPQLVGNAYWYAARDRLRPGTPVTVYYDPDDPWTAYLVPGVRTDALLVVWCLTPFNLVLVAFVWAAWWHLTRRRSFDPARRRCAWPTAGGWAARPDPTTAFAPGAWVVLLVVTAAGFFVCLGYATAFDLPPPAWLPAAMWSVALVLTAVLGWRASRRGILYADEQEGTLTLHGPEGWYAITRGQFRGVEVRTEIRESKEGSYEVYGVFLRWQTVFDREAATKLADYLDRIDADAFADWLRERLA